MTPIERYAAAHAALTEADEALDLACVEQEAALSAACEGHVYDVTRAVEQLRVDGVSDEEIMEEWIDSPRALASALSLVEEYPHVADLIDVSCQS